jgi:hypothetical protein
MKVTINGKRYDSDRCEELAEHDRFSNGSYAGVSTLLLAKNGTYLIHDDSNGQDGYFRNALYTCEDVQGFLDGADITDEQEERLVELGLIEIV